MKLKIVIIMLFMLILPIISFSDTANSIAEDTIIIKVSIIKGPLYFNHAQHESQFDALNGYKWTVNDTTYEFKTKKYTNRYILHSRDKFLSRQNTDVLVIDGGILDGVRAGGTGDEGETIRGEYLDYINQGGGYIGVCGGAHFPLPLENPPNTPFELGCVNRNSFLEGMQTRANGKHGFIVSSEFLGVKKVGDTYKICLRGKNNHDPAACGTAPYSDYNKDNMSDTNGIPFNLTDLDKTHPIFKDYWGDSLYVKALGGGSYIIHEDEDDYVSSLASYPSDYAEHNELTQINAWEFCPKTSDIISDFITFIKYVINNPQGLFAIGDLPNHWQSLFEEGQNYTWLPDLVDLLSDLWEGWKKTNTIIETGNVNDDYSPKTAIIAFNYQGDPEKGRVIMSGPHPFAKTTWYDGEIVNHEQMKNHKRRNGMYHWEYENGDWINPEEPEYNTFGSTERDYTDNSWYLRRQVAWASREVPDDHLPPAYNRSQVVDIDPYMQNSSEFPIYCCVDESLKIKYYGWTKFNLSLYYKWYDGIMENPPEEWIYYDSIDCQPYKFNFNASNAEGDGVYLFCSVLNTTDRNGDYTIDKFPPGYDAKVHVNGNISSQFELENKYLYAKESILFNSNNSSTKPGTQITSYHWDFGDGNNSTDANPTHTYDDDGIYTVNLTIQNNISASNFTIKTIRIHNNHPNIGFKPEYKVVFVNETVNFTDNSSDIDGNITNWSWDFGDTTNSTVKNTSHSYTNSGYYVVSLEITDDDNSTAKTNDGILVIDYLVNQSKSQQANIWNKIQDAVENSTTDDVIYIENGTYNENIIINNSISLIGEDKNNAIIKGSVVMNNPYDYELPEKDEFDYLIVVNMTGCELIMHFNNDSNVGENYSTSSLVVDYSSEGNNGTNNGALWTASTIKGTGAFDLNGVNDSINLSSISGLTGENVTVSAWINWDGNNGIEHPIISQMNTTSGYCLYVNNSTNKPCFKLDDAEAESSTTISSNEWHYVVGTHNATKLKIFIDGVLKGNISKTGSGFDMDCFIGFDNNSNYFDGRIDEVAVWNRTLTDDEIRLIYDSNYGIEIESITFKDSNIGVTPCNHSSLYNCLFINHTVGVMLNNSSDVSIQMCNMSDVETGVKIVDSTPEYFYYNGLVDCFIDNVTSAVMVNGSSNLYIIRCMVNGSDSNLSFSNCDIENISIFDSWSPNNVAPDDPDISGPSQGDINTSYTYYSYTNDTNDDLVFYYFDWGDGNSSGWKGYGTSGLSNYYSDSHKWESQGGYYVKTKTRDIFDYESNWSAPILFRTENLPPLINSVNDTPDPIGFGFNVTITTNVTENTTGNYSGIKTVKVNISYPDDSCVNISMNDIGNDTYEYVFTDTWTVGQYDYSIWAIDNAYNSVTSSGHSFNISVDATISICTINSSYGSNDTINLTDPPGSSYLVGYEFLDDGDVLHIWNKYDNYYFNTSSGIQITNHYDEYWSHNVLMLGYYNNDEWNLIYRTDELNGFNKDIESDNETYVNATLWKDLNYKGFDIRLAIRYYLGVDDNELTVIPYIKNIDDEFIPYNLGFAWEIKDIQIDMTTTDDYIDINGTTYYLNNSGLNETYTNMNTPSFYIKEDTGDDTSESLYLRWDENLNYKVQVKSRDGQYNAPVTLGIKIGTLNVGQEKQTKLFWYDACKSTYHFTSYDTMVAWSNNPANMVDGNTSNYASTTTNMDIETCNGNSCLGSDLGAISKVEIRCFGKYSGSDLPQIHDICLIPSVGGKYTFTPSTTGSWSDWYDITNNPSAPNPWTWTDVQYLIVDVESSIVGAYTLYCSKIEIQVTYNAYPGMSNFYPANGAIGIPITPVLNITVSDLDGDTMNITWLSTSSGSWQIFGTNNSVGNGTYHQTFSNATVNGQWWYWKVNVSDGTNYKESNVFSFFTGYQSKIENTGSTNFTGYLLMQIEYYNSTSSTWILEQEVVNETTPRTINIGSTLALDTIFNLNNVSTSSFTNGDGTYRVYVSFRDPDGDILVCDDESQMEDSYQFTVSTS